MNSLNSIVVGEPDWTLRLSDEVMQNVFSYLDWQSLSIAVVVCKRWNCLGIDYMRLYENSTVKRIVSLLENELREWIFRDLRDALLQIGRKKIFHSKSLRIIQHRAILRKDYIYFLLDDAKGILGNEKLAHLLKIIAEEYLQKGFIARALKTADTICEPEVKCDIYLDGFKRLHKSGDHKRAKETIDKIYHNNLNNVFGAAKAASLLLKIANVLRKSNCIGRAIEVADEIKKARGKSLFYKRIANHLISQGQMISAMRLVSGKCGQRDRSLIYQKICLKWAEMGDVSEANQLALQIPSWRIQRQTMQSIQQL